MLKIFHKSFNLPGLRHGLVRPVLEDDYYPPDFEEEPPRPAASSSGGGGSSGARRSRRPVYEEPDRAAELQALLQQTRAMHLDVDRTLAGEVAETIDDEAIGEELEPASAAAHAHQRQVLRRPGSSGTSKPSSATGRARGRW